MTFTFFVMAIHFAIFGLFIIWLDTLTPGLDSQELTIEMLNGHEHYSNTPCLFDELCCLVVMCALMFVDCDMACRTLIV